MPARRSFAASTRRIAPKTIIPQAAILAPFGEKVTLMDGNFPAKPGDGIRFGREAR